MDRIGLVGDHRSREEPKERKEELMSAKWSRKWYKRVSREWDRYIGDRATLREYAAGGAPYLDRLRQDLKEWWGNHPERAKRLTPEKIEAVAQRLADYLKAYTSPMTPPEVLEQFRSEWLAPMKDAVPADAPLRTQLKHKQMRPAPAVGRAATTSRKGKR